MRKSVLIVIAMCIFGTTLHAQSPLTLYAGGLASIPSSPSSFTDYFKNGYHGMVGLGMKSLPYFQFVFKVEYHEFKSDPKNFTGFRTVTRGLWLYGIDGRLAIGIPAAPIKPFILAGIGLARVTSTDLVELVGSGLVPDELKKAAAINQDRLYLNIGGGIELKFLPMISLFAQARIVKVSTRGESTEFIPITLGIKFF